MSPTLTVLPLLPPELILPMTTMPPSALELARPPLPAEATPDCRRPSAILTPSVLRSMR